MRIMDAVMEGLARALDLRGERQRVLAQNVANADTPGYRAREVDFRAAMEAAFAERAEKGAVPEPEAGQRQMPVINDPAGVVREDGNSVDLDRQMVKLSANAMSYRVLSRILARKFDLIRMAIETSRR